jgi:peptide/nickel transport system permease protein
MWQYIVRRILIMIPTFFGILFVVFLLLRVANPDPISADLQMGMRGGQISQQAIERLRAHYHLDKPWYEQYARLVWVVLTLDGNAWQDGVPIRDKVAESLPVTLMLSTITLALAYMIAIPLGVFSAVKQYSTTDRITTVIVFMLYSLPSFWVGALLIIFLATGNFVQCLWWDEPGCFPLQGWHSFEGFDQMSFGEQVGDVAFHLVLPVLALLYNAFASTSRYMRTSMLETIRQDYIRTARAKGLPERVVIFKHALRNSLIPVVTVLGLSLPYLVGGAIIIEIIFGIRGMGFLTLEALRMPDYPLVFPLVALLSIFVMLGILLSDILYAIVDPRIRYDRGGGK